MKTKPLFVAVASLAAAGRREQLFLLAVFPRQRDSHLKHGTFSRLAKSADGSPMSFGDPFPDG
jgi:hypothetical protein